MSGCCALSINSSARLSCPMTHIHPGNFRGSCGRTIRLTGELRRLRRCRPKRMVRLFRLCEAAARVVGRKNRQALRQPISPNVVRADELEPAQRFRTQGFSYQNQRGQAAPGVVTRASHPVTLISSAGSPMIVNMPQPQLAASQRGRPCPNWTTRAQVTSALEMICTRVGGILCVVNIVDCIRTSTTPRYEGR